MTRRFVPPSSRAGRGRRAGLVAARRRGARSAARDRGRRAAVRDPARPRRGLRQERPRGAAAVGARVRARRGRLDLGRPVARATRGRGCSGCPTSGRSSSTTACRTTAPSAWPSGSRGRGRRSRSASTSSARTAARRSPSPTRRSSRDYVESVRRLQPHGELRLPEPELPEHARRPGLLRRPLAPARAARRARRRSGSSGRCSSRSRRSPARASWRRSWRRSSRPRSSPASRSTCRPAAAPGMPGAVSGPPAAAAAERTVAELYRAARGRWTVIGSGGVLDRGRRLPHDPARRVAGAGLHGAGLRGPRRGRPAHAGLAELLERDGFARSATRSAPAPRRRSTAAG